MDEKQRTIDARSQGGRGASLSPRECEVLALVAEGCSNREIANRLVITVQTTQHHVHSILAKLGCSNRTEAASFARAALATAESPSGPTRTAASARAPRQLPGNLPLPVTSFVGRADDLAWLALELPRRSLVTLVGPGGVGKTRLAIEAAWQAAGAFPEGGWFCDLEPVTDPSAVPAVVLSTLGFRVQEGMSVVESVVDGLKRRRLLLILDNCEHVLDFATEVVVAVNVGCPSVTVLVTSREPLGADGERVRPVRSLDPAGEGVALFLDRATAADAGFDPGTHLDTVEAICARLDGIPLAIELAAGRVRTMTVADIEAHLNDRFRLLRGTGRGRVERHRTLATAVRWSYDLLTPAEQTLFDRLSVFAGSFDLTAAQTICIDGDEAGTLDPSGLMASLVERSMVSADRSGERTRYRLLETFRQFGQPHLSEEERLGLRNAHLAYYVALSEDAQVDIEERNFSLGRATFTREWDNIREAAMWAIAAMDQEATTRLQRALRMRHLVEAEVETGEWAVSALAATLRAPDIYASAASLVGWSGDFEGQISHARAGLALAPDALGPETMGCWGALMVGFGAVGDFELGRDAAENAYRAASSGSWRALYGALSASLLADPVESHQRLRESLDLAGETGNAACLGVALYSFGAFEYRKGDTAAALEHCRASFEVSRTHNIPLNLAWAAYQVAMIGNDLGVDQPARVWSNAIEIALDTVNWVAQLANLENVALWFASTGRADPAGTLFGYLEAKGIGQPARTADRRNALAILAQHPEAANWKAAGTAMDRYTAVDYALRMLRESP
jgi:predicted ATPase/DNA-binding CsgD family transcriptional regulator